MTDYEVEQLKRELAETKQRERHWFDRATKAVTEARADIFPRAVKAEAELAALTAKLATATELLRATYARHCECRPLRFDRKTYGHSHDCDTGITDPIEEALASSPGAAGGAACVLKCRVPGPGNGNSKCCAPMRMVCYCPCHRPAPPVAEKPEGTL
jgi:hypothetical protein